MKHVLSTSVAALSFGIASAQVPVPNVSKLRLHLGYQFGTKFDDQLGRGTELNGLVLGVEYPFISQLKFDVAGGVFWVPSSDGNLFRFMALGRTVIPGSGVYAKGGIGFATLAGKDFVGDANGVVFQIGVEVPIVRGYAQRVIPMIDLYYVGGKSELSGIVVGVTLGF